jgi:hypothetical protein
MKGLTPKRLTDALAYFTPRSAPANDKGKFQPRTDQSGPEGE